MSAYGNMAYRKRMTEGSAALKPTVIAAYELPLAPSRVVPGQVVPPVIQPRKQPQRVAKEQAAQPRLVPQNADEQLIRDQIRIRRSMNEHRRSGILTTLILIALIGIVIGGIVMNQAAVSSANLANNKLAREIRKLEMSNAQRKLNLIQDQEQSELRTRAVELGMQDPGADQIINVFVPRQDSFSGGVPSHVLVNARADNAELMALMENMAAYLQEQAAPGTFPYYLSASGEAAPEGDYRLGGIIPE